MRAPPIDADAPPDAHPLPDEVTDLAEGGASVRWYAVELAREIRIQSEERRAAIEVVPPLLGGRPLAWILGLAATLAIGEARHDIREGRLLPVPRHLQDSHYPGAKLLGHGEGYQYAHDAPDAIAAQDYLGVERNYYRPTDRGFEKELAARLEQIRAKLRGSSAL